MGFAPNIGHDEAALRSGRQTFLEAVSIVWRNDERPAFICSRWGPKSEDGKNYGDAEKNNTKKLVAAERNHRAPGGRQIYYWHGKLKNWGKLGKHFVAKTLESSVNAQAQAKVQPPTSSLTNKPFCPHSHPHDALDRQLLDLHYDQNL